MLSISSAISGSGQAFYYLELAREDYYLEGGEPPGKWFGGGAKLFGLSGDVEKNALKNLFEGRAPDGKRDLVQNAGSEKRQSAWDLTFSAPKSVSVAWSQATPEIQAKIQHAHDQAVRAALSYLEDTAGITRRQSEGRTLDSAELVFAVFQHGTSRAQEPQIHSHALLVNAAIREDGTTGTIVSQAIFRLKMAAGALYRAALATNLQQGLGFEIEKDGRFFKVAGVKKSLCDACSTRRKEVKEELAERGERGAVAAKKAARNTREVKEHVARGPLFERWRELGKEHSWSTAELLRLIGRARPAQTPELTAQDLLSETLAEITSEQSFFSERQLVRGLSERAQGTGLSADEILSAIRKELKSKDIVPLGVHRSEELFTTKDILASEKELLQTVKNGQASVAHAVAITTAEKVIEKHPHLSKQQKGAVQHITTEPGSVKLVSGMAGTGKSTMLDVAREAWEKQGFTVLGAAISGKAACGLEESAHIKSATIAKTLADLEKGPLGIHVKTQRVFPNASESNPLSKIAVPHLAFSPNRITLSPKTILVVDEASMIGTQDMKRLVDATTKAGAKLVLVGDERQLQPIDAGGPFRALMERHGYASLTEIKRQNEKWGRDLVQLFADGKAKEALLLAKDLDLVHIANTKPDARTMLIRGWKGRGVEKPEENLILAATRDDTAKLNQLAQDERIKAGKIGRQALEIDGSRLHVGDRVLCTQNSRTLGVQNGALGTVTKISKDTLALTLDSGKHVTIPIKVYRNLELGYAVTTHKSQGMTTRNAFVLLDPNMQDRELSYVQASRARSITRFYVDRATAGPNFEEIAKQMATSHQKDLAATLAEKNRERYGQEIERHPCPPRAFSPPHCSKDRPAVVASRLFRAPPLPHRRPAPKGALFLYRPPPPRRPFWPSSLFPPRREHHGLDEAAALHPRPHFRLNHLPPCHHAPLSARGPRASKPP